jgi:3-oxo-5-alpha-steroid 4-dehydrogenase 1
MQARRERPTTAVGSPMFSLFTGPFFLAAWVLLALISGVLLLRIQAPYGRYQRRGWGPLVPARLAWPLMESPALVLVPLLFALSEYRASLVAWTFVALWAAHYAQRTLVYPFLSRVAGRPMPLSILLLSGLFNLINGSFIGTDLFWSGRLLGASWFTDSRFVVGCGLFVVGMGINLWSDAKLRGLRSETQRGYQIPRGGLYRWVSCPNYLGEIVEWIGFALLTGSVAGAAFAVWTMANLLPRALAHHRWYRAEFKDYPAERRALIPFLL